MKGFQRLEEVFKISKTICIAHGGDVSEPSGGTNRVIAFATALRDAGFDVHLIVPSPKRRFSSDLQNIRIHTVPIKAGGVKDQPIRALLISLKAKRIAEKNNAILQIEHSTLAGFATLIGCSDFVLDMHDLAFMSPLYGNLPFAKVVQKFIYMIEKRAVTKAFKIIVVSNPMKEFIIKEWDISEDKIVVIPNGYFESKIKGLEKNDRVIDEHMIVRLGTLFRHLDVENVINLAKSLTDENIKIYLIGDGELRPYLEERIRRENLRNIVITGWLPYEEAIRLTAKAKLVFLTIKRSLTTEMACPIKILDYAALGKPMVLSDVSELSKTFKENQAALVSNPENPDAFIENVRVLLENENLRKRISSNAKKLVKDFTWEKQGEKLVKMMERLR